MPTTDPAKWINPLQGSLDVRSGFGPRSAPKTSGGRGSSNHQGIDLAAPVGTRVLAVADGTVQKAQWDPNGGGNYIQIDHGTGPDGKNYKSQYLHLKSFAVTPGETVKQGQVIGYSGNTGNSGGPHLHYGVKVNDQKVNPAPYLHGSGKALEPSKSEYTPGETPTAAPVGEDTAPTTSQGGDTYKIQDTYLDTIYPNRGSYFGRMAQDVFTIMTYGDAGIKAGDVIILDLPEGRPQDLNKSMANPWLSGFFLVATVKHIITQSSYITIMDIYKNSYAAPNFFTEQSEQDQKNGIPHVVNKYSQNQPTDSETDAPPADKTNPSPTKSDVNPASPTMLKNQVPTSKPQMERAELPNSTAAGGPKVDLPNGGTPPQPGGTTVGIVKNDAPRVELP